jgi:predicted amidophosphoribosyltransferase
MEIILCQRCQKEIPKIATRKYCAACRVLVDKEMSRARSKKLRVPDELLKRKRKKSI